MDKPPIVNEYTYKHFDATQNKKVEKDPRINLILAFIDNGRTKAKIAKASKISYWHLDDILHERQGLSTKMYNKIYKGLDKLVSKDSDLLQDFGMENL